MLVISSEDKRLSHKPDKRISPLQYERLTRLACIQALFQIHQTNSTAEFVSHEFITLRQNDELIDGVYLKFDVKQFECIVLGTSTILEAIDHLIAAHLKTNWRIDRLDLVLLSILRAGVFELSSPSTFSVARIISSYVDLAKSFFGPKESGFINATLDSISKHIATLNHQATIAPSIGADKG